MRQFIQLMLAAASISISSCVSVHRYFELFKYPPLNSSSAFVKTNGIFVREEKEQTGQFNYFILYQDGTVLFQSDEINSISDSEFWANPRRYLEQELSVKKTTGYDDNLAGHYMVRGDSIRIQYFLTLYQQTIKHNSIDLYGIVKDDSTIFLTRRRCQWCDRNYYPGDKADVNKIFDPVIKYRFYKTNFKPDPSDIWFKKKNWYKQHVYWMN